MTKTKKPIFFVENKETLLGTCGWIHHQKKAHVGWLGELLIPPFNPLMLPPKSSFYLCIDYII